MILGLRGVQAGNSKRLQIDQNMRSTWEGNLVQMFDRFVSILVNISIIANIIIIIIIIVALGDICSLGRSLLEALSSIL